MAGYRTGTPTIIKFARKLCQVYHKLGAADLEAKTSPAYKAAVVALALACHAFETADNFPGQIDSVAPHGPEDPA